MSEDAPEAQQVGHQAPAGWYPTPGGQQRWWDGQAWTEHAAPGIQTTGPHFIEDRETDTGLTVGAWVAAVLTLGYMLPWAVAATRGRPNASAIALVNLFTGWTGVGWIVALVMACQTNQKHLVR